ncbi:methyltransferase family protein [Quisquiliibacterium transsilvanicum]
MFLTALGLFWWAARAYGDLRPSIAFSPGPPCVLVTSGPYKFIRHPFYSAYMMFWLAFAVHSWSVWALVPALTMGVIYYKAAKSEEDSIMSSALRDAYIDYSRSAGMFLPRLV